MEAINYQWGHTRRFNAFSNYTKQKYGERMQKVSLDAGFTCPNRDGSIAFGGCTYCNNDSFNPSYCKTTSSITQQIDEGIIFLQKRYKTQKYLAYFQAYSNTYAPLEKLKKLYEEALSHPKIVGLVIGTRVDCVDEPKLNYLQELAKTTPITIEYGIESCYDTTLNFINRGHNFEQTCQTIKATANRGITIGSHLIFGLPGETRAQMLAEAKTVSQLPINFIKLHQLHIVKNTVMAHQYKKQPEIFQLFSLEEYLDFIVDFLELLNPEIIVERLFGEAPPYIMAGPTWGNLRNDAIMNLIEKNLEKRATWQGRLFKQIEQQVNS